MILDIWAYSYLKSQIRMKKTYRFRLLILVELIVLFLCFAALNNFPRAVSAQEATQPPTSLNTSLIAFWKLNEATSATRNDSVGSHHLTNVNSVEQIAGRVGYGAHFTRTESDRLSISDNANLSTGDIDFTIAAWIYLDSKPGDMVIVGKFIGSTNQREYVLKFSKAVDRLEILTSPNGTTTGQCDNFDTLFGSPPTATWIFVVAWHDSVANTLNIQTNNGTTRSVSCTTGVFDSTSPFVVGALNNTESQYWNGRVDALGFWKRVLTSEERTALYNAGNGSEDVMFLPNLTSP